MMIILLQSSSMSAISWVVKITVVPYCLLMSLIAARTFSFTTISRPMVGSSRNRTLGLWSKLAARSARILCPKERVRTGWVINSLKVRTPSRYFILWSKSALGTSYISLRMAKVSLRGRSHQSWVLWPKTTPICRAFFCLCS